MARVVVTDVIADLFNDMDYTVDVSAVSPLTGNWRLDVTDTFYAMPGMTIKDANNTECVVLSFVENSTITVSATTPPIAGVFTFPKINYRHGTPIHVNEEITLDSRKKATLPLVWMLEIMSVSWELDPLSAIDSEPDLTLYFLGKSDNQNWSIEQHTELVVKPMQKLAERFCDALIKDKSRFATPSSMAEWMPLVKLGLTFTNPKSNDKFSSKTHIINEYVSGGRLRLKVPIRKTC